MRFRTILASLLVTLSVHGGMNVQEKILGVGAGGGLPQLVALEVQALLVPKFQMGLAFGFAGDGKSLSPEMNLPGQVQTLVTGDQVRIEPTTKIAWWSVSPFIRFYPNDTNFYLQLTLTLLKPRAKLTSDVKTAFGQPIAGAELTGEVDVTQVLPTLTMGHQFTTDIFFLNFALGISYLADIYIDRIAFGGTIPDSLGGTAANQPLINASKAEIEANLNQSTKDFRRQFPFIPSFMITVGFMI